ncbi:MAG: 1-acyl-sn-glycerol-3-phosphate acyltransferase [Xanthomonadales bacterium]|nr:1-acyl-sn-glycerol-3-phosphate acyltransferase [Xanthomonadales bacterium]
MIALLERGWRVIATGIAFSSFGIGGLLLRLVYFPLLDLGVRDRARKARLARAMVKRSFAAHIELMRVLGILRYTISGAEKLRREGLLILANHPTLIDVVFLISLVPNADCVVKARLARNSFTRGPVRATNYICNDSGAGLIEDCIGSIRAGSNLVIFPEGTRTPLDGRTRLQRGAANVAVRGGIDVTPVLIDCSPRSLTKGLPWWRVPARRMQFSIEVRDDIAVQPFLVAAEGEAAIAARRLTHHLQSYFETEKPAHAGA